MNYCTFCGTELNSNYKFCITCGADVTGTSSKEPKIEVRELKSKFKIMRILRRISVTAFAFLIGSVFIALWREFIPASALSGAVMAVIAVGIVFGAWKWTERFK